jgi:outer membrane receptor for ferrienterochelin and colicins
MPMRPEFALIIAIFISHLSASVLAQDSSETNASVTYPASWFIQYGAVSANDMLNRIPGIDLALTGNQVPTIGNNNRGLGGEGQILINGKRLAGKANEASSQLDRIAAARVNYIEIIRGTSGDLDVRNSGQLVNIVLFEEQASSSLSTELGFAHYHDGTVEPQGRLSYSGQTGSLNYLFSADISSGYENQQSFEKSVLSDQSENETREFKRIREQTMYRLNTNIVYEPTATDRIAFNALYGESDPPATLLRTITDLKTSPPATRVEREDLPANSNNWELGSDYEHNFVGGGKYKVLLIVNEKNDSTTRERFIASGFGQPETKDLFLDTSSRYRERIVRTSYARDVAQEHSLEFGIEGAQTIQNSSLRLGINAPGVRSPDFGGLRPVNVPNAVSEVEEFRYEGFTIHNWQINPRMSLESSLLYEVSEIEQTGDVNKKRDFAFVKPKLDFRFDISRSLQFRMSVEKDVSQLSFADFSAGVNQQDDDQNTVAGNPEMEQEITWRYNVNLDYRLPNDGGVLSSRFFYYDIDGAIGKVDVSPDPQNLVSTNGNAGDGKVVALYLNASIRLGFLQLPQVLVTAGLNLEDAWIYDPLIAKERTVIPFDRGSFRVGFRHEIPAHNFSYGVNYQDGIGNMGGTGGNRVRYDIDNVLFFGVGKVRPDFTAFAEKTGWGNLTYRMEVSNGLDAERCLKRKRYNGYLRDGDLREIERSCATTGAQFIFKVRSTF